MHTVLLLSFDWYLFPNNLKSIPISVCLEKIVVAFGTDAMVLFLIIVSLDRADSFATAIPCVDLDTIPINISVERGTEYIAISVIFIAITTSVQYLYGVYQLMIVCRENESKHADE